jgi:hypothetical protein
MTAKQLIKTLEKLVAEHGNVPVCADCPALLDASNGVFEIANVTEAELGMIRQCDGDGFTIQNKDGTERTRRCIVLR